MALPNYPNNPSVNDTFVNGGVTFQWDGEKWKALSNANNSLTAQLADPDSTVLVGGVEAQSIEKTFNNIVDMKAADLSVGQSARTLGYYSPNDGGGGEYVIVATGTGTADDGFYLNLSNGNQAELQAVSLYNPLQWGVKADGVTDNQTQMQALLDFVPTGEAISLPAGIILSDNLTIPNKEFSIIGLGRNVSILKAKTGLTNSDYFIATAAYVNNETSANLPITMTGVEVRGDGQAKNVFVWYGFFADFSLCVFRDPADVADSTAFLLTSDGISGSASAFTAVENRFESCRFDGNMVGAPFRQADSGAKLTDGFMQDCLLYDGDSFFTTLAGWNITNNHFYGAGASNNGKANFRKMSFGTTISGNYFERDVIANEFLDETVSMNNNVFIENLTVSFGSAGKVIILNNNNFQGAGTQVRHDFFDASKHIVINGGSFSNSTPVVWTNGSSTGRITMNDVFVYDATFASIGGGYILRGSKNAQVGRHYKVYYDNAAPTTLTWNRGDTVINGLPSAGGNWGFVCVTAGTPGTWKAFGTIEA